MIILPTPVALSTIYLGGIPISFKKSYIYYDKSQKEGGIFMGYGYGPYGYGYGIGPYPGPAPVPYGGGGFGFGFALIIVLLVLLLIFGFWWFTSGGCFGGFGLGHNGPIC